MALDERFGYLRETFAGDPSWQNLQRNRYRVLWDTYLWRSDSRENSSESPGKRINWSEPSVSLSRTTLLGPTAECLPASSTLHH